MMNHKLKFHMPSTTSSQANDIHDATMDQNIQSQSGTDDDTGLFDMECGNSFSFPWDNNNDNDFSEMEGGDSFAFRRDDDDNGLFDMQGDDSFSFPWDGNNNNGLSEMEGGDLFSFQGDDDNNNDFSEMEGGDSFSFQGDDDLTSMEYDDSTDTPIPQPPIEVSFARSSLPNTFMQHMGIEMIELVSKHKLTDAAEDDMVRFVNNIVQHIRPGKI
jgi:hypothetical protein